MVESELKTKQIQKKLINISAELHDLWEGSGALLNNLEEYDAKLKAEKEKLMQDLEFLRETPRDKVGRFIEAKLGWYQDRYGNLYKYDGVIWDVVPEGSIEELEYLSE